MECNAAFALKLANRMPDFSMEWSDELRDAWMKCATTIFEIAAPRSIPEEAAPLGEGE